MRPTRALVFAIGLSVAMAACSSSTNGAPPVGAQGQAHVAQPVAKVTPMALTVVPANQAQNVRLDTPLMVRVTNGVLASVTVQAGGATDPVPGNFADGYTRWNSQPGLDPNATYGVTVSATDVDARVTTTTTSFHTMGGDRLTTSTTPGDGDSVGVGMPIKLQFNTDIPDAQKAGILARISVLSSPAQAGGWHWFANNEVHYRPQNFWLPGTTVAVNAHFKGVDAGGGVWGQGDWNETFTVGDKHVSIIDAAAHQMQVFSNDQLQATYPVSTGRPSLQTISGTLVVWYKTPDVLMDSLGLGIPRNSPDGYYEHVYQDVAISTDGFYVHSAPWSEWAQGLRNVSHGCVNLAPGNAASFFRFSLPGDVVVVKNTTRPASADDGEGDWQLDFGQFQSA